MPISNPPSVVDISLAGNTAGALGLISSGTAIFAGGNNITLSQNGQSVTISGAAIPAATNFSLNGTSSSVSLVAGNNITLQSGASSITIVAGGGAAGTNTISASGTSIAGTALSLALVAGANISLQTATAAGSMTVSVSGIIQTSSVSLTALGNTTSSSAGTFSNLLNFSGAGIASVGVGAGSVTISVPAPAASGVLYVSATSAAGGATAGTVTSAAIASTLSLVAGNNITLSQGSNAAITFSVPTPAASGILYVSATSAAGGATAGTVTSAPIGSTLSLIAGANMTLSQGSNAAITIIGPNPTAGAAGTNTISAAGTSIAGTALSFALVAGNNIGFATASGAGSLTVTISESMASKVSVTQNLPLQQIGGVIASASGTVTGTAGFGSSLFLQRIFIPAAMTLTEADLALGVSFNATSNGAGTLSQSFVLYSFGNSSSLASVMSVSGTNAWQTGTSTSGAVVSLTQFQGGWSVPQIHPLTFASTSISAGEYVVGNLLNFAQASSTWTIALYGALANITQSTTLSNVTSVSGVTTNMVSNIANLAITNVEATKTFASSAASLGTVGINGIARTILSASSSTTGVSAVNTSTQSIVPQFLSVPNFVYIGTNSTTSALPSVFLAGIMSTGAVPVAITLTSAAVTFSGTAAGAQPYFALLGQ